MKTSVLILFCLVCCSAIAQQPGRIWGSNHSAVMTMASYDAKGSKQPNDVTLTNTVDTFKSPGTETRPTTTFNTGTPAQIDNDVTDENVIIINSGITKPDSK